MRNRWIAGLCLLLAGTLTAIGCTNTAVDLSEFARGPAPLRMPSPGADCGCCYEDSLTGGQIFSMYCSYCHNAPALAERPFSNYQNVAVHMRVRANLTGKEFTKLEEWLRRWHDVPPPNPPVEPSPKRLTFSQPIGELRPPGSGASGPQGTPDPGPEAPVAAPGPQEAQQPPAQGAGEKP